MSLSMLSPPRYGHADLLSPPGAIIQFRFGPDPTQCQILFFLLTALAASQFLHHSQLSSIPHQHSIANGKKQESKSELTFLDSNVN
jgi:hypothetical protein